ncbi:acyl-CoA dehydrogenase family protein [Novosphingobium sp.]|uniref:acyl-CoA dehydrogenase family protein n=1 Tax=Novosphingobium sp. TaxID=1874826 RepID=UPI00286A36B3|nr:acyl-CoA dehydrogenase family protein [Novosphingobium sp.]
MTDTADLTAFRAEVRAFLANSLPADLARAGRRATSVFSEPEHSIAWQKILTARGWGAIDWPVKYGGTGWSALQKYVFAAECARAGTPNLLPQGLKMVAPVLMHYGTVEQKAFFLPRILSGEHYWCQGFSEPGSGSDLASLKLKAERDGDHYVLNGSKIWTTHAHHANWMFALVRTSAEGKPQAGISFVLIDMATPGLKIDPIISLAGEHELNQVFFDNVRVPIANRLGAENEGWSVAKYLLTFERGGRYAPTLFAALGRLRDEAGDDPLLQERIAREAVTVEALEAIELKSIGASGAQAALYASVLKVQGTEAEQRIAVLGCEVAGPEGWAIPDGQSSDRLATAVPRYLNGRAASIYAGSNEIQRDLIARVSLG